MGQRRAANQSADPKQFLCAVGASWLWFWNCGAWCRSAAVEQDQNTAPFGGGGCAEPTVVAHPLQPGGEHVLKEAADELVG